MVIIWLVVLYILYVVERHIKRALIDKPWGIGWVRNNHKKMGYSGCFHLRFHQLTQELYRLPILPSNQRTVAIVTVPIPVPAVNTCHDMVEAESEVSTDCVSALNIYSWGYTYLFKHSGQMVKFTLSKRHPYGQPQSLRSILYRMLTNVR